MNKFTLEHANRSLVYIRLIMKDIQNVTMQMQELRSIENAVSINKVKNVRKEFALLEQMEELLIELSKTGCECYSLDPLVIDFPGVLNGKAVLFSLEGHEENLNHWRFPNENYTKKKELNSTQKLASV